MKNYLVILSDIKDKFVVWNDSFYIRSHDNFGDIYVPIEEPDMGKCWSALILKDKDVAFSSKHSKYLLIP